MHRRTAIRHALRDVLMDALPQMRTQIYKHRAAALDRLPAIRIYTLEERQMEEREDFNEDVVNRVQVVVEVLVSAKGGNADDDVDAICLQVERAVLAEQRRAWDANQRPFGGACLPMNLESTSIDYEDDNETRMQATMTFGAATQQTYIQE